MALSRAPCYGSESASYHAYFAFGSKDVVPMASFQGSMVYNKSSFWIPILPSIYVTSVQAKIIVRYGRLFRVVHFVFCLQLDGAFVADAWQRYVDFLKPPFHPIKTILYVMVTWAHTFFISIPVGS